jgi:phosphate transport system substrate-binding protein
MKVKILIAAAMLLSASFLPAMAEEIRIEGGTAAITTVFSPIKEAYENSSGDSLTIVLSDPTKALISLEKGKVDLATLNSFALDDAITKAKAQGITIDPATLNKIEVATSNLVVFINKSNKIKKLGKEQLKSIFTGKTTNWREVGGEDRPIEVYWGKETTYLNRIFSKNILDGESVTPTAKSVTNHFNLRDEILGNPGAIAINTSGLITPSTKTPEIPVMKLPLLVYTKGEPSAKVQRLLNYYKEEFGYMNE